MIEEEPELPVRVELATEENKKAYNLEEEVQPTKPTPLAKEDNK